MDKNKKAKRIIEGMEKNLGKEETKKFMDSLLGMMAISGFTEAKIFQVSNEITDLINERIIEKYILDSKLPDDERDEILENTQLFLKKIKSEIIEFTDSLTK